MHTQITTGERTSLPETMTTFTGNRLIVSSGHQKGIRTVRSWTPLEVGVVLNKTVSDQMLILSLYRLFSKQRAVGRGEESVTHTHSHTLTHILTHTHSLIYSLTHTHTLNHTHSLTVQFLRPRQSCSV